MKFDGTVEEFLELVDAVSQPLTDEEDDDTLYSCLIDRNGSSPHVPTSTPLVHYIIVRADLPHGVQVAQTIHASAESAALSARYVSPGTISVALHAAHELHLEVIKFALVTGGIAHHNVYESDNPYSGQLMAIGLLPIPVEDRDLIRAVLGKLPLVT